MCRKLRFLLTKRASSRTIWSIKRIHFWLFSVKSCSLWLITVLVPYLTVSPLWTWSQKSSSFFTTNSLSVPTLNETDNWLSFCVRRGIRETLGAEGAGCSFGYFLSVLFDRWTEDNCHSYQLHLQNYFVLQNLWCKRQGQRYTGTWHCQSTSPSISCCILGSNI